MNLRVSTPQLLWRGTTLALLMATLWWLRLPVADAQAPGSLLLLPSTPRAFVELGALNVNVGLACDETGCALAIEQVYHLQNRDRLKGAEIEVALQGGEAYPVEASFSPPGAAAALGAGAWRLRFGTEQTVVARLRYSAPLAGQLLAHWRWDPARLSAWGRTTSARVELRLPEAVPEDLLLAMQPPASGFDGRILHWEYEEPPALPPFEVWLVTPATWKREAELRHEGQHLALAELYRALGREAARLGAPYPEPYARVLGELYAAAQEGSPDAYLALADVYLERAGTAPHLAHNYQLLAAEALEEALGSGADVGVVAPQLVQLYLALADQARMAGEPAEALHYIALARTRAAEGKAADAATVEEVTLEWAVDLASKGRVSEALVQLGAVLSPRVRDALYRYAPAIVGARTDVALTATTRTVRYQLYLYPPLAGDTRQALEALVGALDGLPPVRASLTWHDARGDPWAELEIRAEYQRLEDLAAIGHAIDQAAGIEADLLHALIAMPWLGGPGEFGVQRTPWVDLYTYRERPSFAALCALRDEQAQYTVWRLVEVGSGRPTAERDRLEQQLTALALREQRQIWENLVSSSYWAYHVTFEEPSALPTLSWLVGWGQERSLEIAHRHFWWRRIAADGALGLGVLLGLAVILGCLRRLARRRAGGLSTSEPS